MSARESEWVSVEFTGSLLIEHQVRVKGRFHPGRPPLLYRADGSPGDPEEPAELEIESALLSNGRDMVEHLTRQQKEDLESQGLYTIREERRKR